MEKQQIRVGIVGYSGRSFNIKRGTSLLRTAYDEVQKTYAGKEIIIVSGLTDLGIPSLAYREAVRRGLTTVGVACSRASRHKCFEVDERVIVGDQWGDESETFINMIDVLVRVGGGNQSFAETQAAKDKGIHVLEYELPVANG